VPLADDATITAKQGRDDQNWRMSGTGQEIFTVGHSTHDRDRFLALLKKHGIRALADVRRHPGSRRLPHFNGEQLAAALAGEGIRYEQLGESLGGRRRAVRGRLNDGWRVAGFRAYADHMETAEFEDALRRLENLAVAAPTAFMCAEADWRRCHRRLIADALLVRNWRVRHILRTGGLEDHALPSFAVTEGTRISYPAAQATLYG
jgi:uncharacterized protein (DUF488 family)